MLSCELCKCKITQLSRNSKTFCKKNHVLAVILLLFVKFFAIIAFLCLRNRYSFADFSRR